MLLQVSKAPKSQRHRTLLRRYGWGVPSLDRACWSATNALTLVAQETLRPYGDWQTGSSAPTQDMHIHAFPWPTEELQKLFDATVMLRVTLSYFIEPNPARRGWKNRHLYQSHGLRFAIPREDEALDDFRARVNKENQEEGERTSFKTTDWTLRQTVGSVHSDWWEGSASALANRGYIAVYPVAGWWKERRRLERWRNKIRYSLVVSILAPEVGVDIYTPVANMVGVPTEVVI